MKKIIISIASIGLVSALAIGGTIAFYQDTETSQGNVFVAGTIDLTVDSQGAVYNSESLDGWDPVNLTDEKFFSFGDLKPADHGWRNLSLHVSENDSWACLLVTNKYDDENTPIDPELDAGDTTDDGHPNGELDSNTEVFVWQDNNDDGLYNAGDNALTAEDGVTLDTLDYVVVADSTSGSPLTNTETRQIYIAWCAGDQTVDGGAGTITCDGGGMSDVAQTDKFSADMTVYATQTRHNDGFKCSQVELPETQTDTA